MIKENIFTKLATKGEQIASEAADFIRDVARLVDPLNNDIAGYMLDEAKKLEAFADQCGMASCQDIPGTGGTPADQPDREALLALLRVGNDLTYKERDRQYRLRDRWEWDNPEAGGAFMREAERMEEHRRAFVDFLNAHFPAWQD